MVIEPVDTGSLFKGSPNAQLFGDGTLKWVPGVETERPQGAPAARHILGEGSHCGTEILQGQVFRSGSLRVKVL